MFINPEISKHLATEHRRDLLADAQQQSFARQIRTETGTARHRQPLTYRRLWDAGERWPYEMSFRRSNAGRCQVEGVKTAALSRMARSSAAKRVAGAPSTTLWSTETVRSKTSRISIWPCTARGRSLIPPTTT